MVQAVTRKPRRKPDNYTFLGRYNYFVPGVAEMFILLALLLVGALFGNVVSFIFSLLLSSEAALEYGMLVAYPVMFIPPMMYAGIKSGKNSFFKDGVRVDSSHFQPVGGIGCAIAVILATLALGFCSDAISMVMPEMPDYLKELMESLTTGELWIDLLSVSVFAPVFEEWLCRGMVLRGLLNNNVKPVWAIIISAAFFALIHMNPWQAVPAFLLGILFAYVYYRTGSLKLTMLMHCTNNTFAVICSHIPALEDMESWMDVFTGKQFWLIFTGCLLLLCLFVYIFGKIPLKSKSGNSDKVPCMFSE